MDDNTIVKLFYRGMSMKEIAASLHSEERDGKRFTDKEALEIAEWAVYDNYMKNICGGIANRR